MSDVQELQAPSSEIVLFRPEEIEVDQHFNVRPWSYHTEAEDTRIERLADRIELLGQLEPILVIMRPAKAAKGLKGGARAEGLTGSDGEPREVPCVFAGHRRRRAIQLINNRRSIRSNGTAALLMVKCIIDRSPGDIRQKAFSSNHDRENMLPMDTAELISELRIEYGPDASGTAKIAKYLGVSKAQVTQHEKLLKPECSHELRLRMADGTITMDTAINLMNTKEVDPEKHEEIIKLGKKIQDNEALEKISNEKGQASLGAKERRLEQEVAKKRVRDPAIQKAIKLVVPGAKVKRGMRDVKELFEGLDGPGYGHLDSAVRLWFRYFLDKWTTGVGTDKVLVSMFDTMVKGAYRGADQVTGKGPDWQVKLISSPPVPASSATASNTEAKTARPASSTTPSKKHAATDKKHAVPRKPAAVEKARTNKLKPRGKAKARR